MDMKALMSAMLSSDSLQGMSQRTGTTKKGVESVLASALPSLISGAAGQAQNEETAASFAGALEDHAKDDTSSLGSFLSNVDLTDGGKILGHLLGSKTDATADEAAGKSGLSSSQTKAILSAASPLLMSLLGQQTQAQKKTEETSSPIGAIMGSLLANADMGSLLGSVLGTGDDVEEAPKRTSSSSKKTTSSSKKASSSSKKTSSSSKKTSSSSKKTSSSSKKTTSSSKKKSPVSEKEEEKSGGILDALMGLLK